MKKMIVAALVAGLATVGNADVTFDGASGFSGKGDVQLACGWNNAALQGNAAGVAFKYVETTTYAIDCSKLNPGNGTIQYKTETTESGVSGEVTFDAKTKKQVVGFVLGAVSTDTTDDGVPVCVGDPKNPAASGWKAISEVYEISSSDAKLYVRCGLDKAYVELPITPVAP